MSWSDRLRFLAALALAAPLSGCFQPMYGEAANPGLVQALHEIEVTPVPERLGHYLTDNLISRLNGTGETPKPKYRLLIKVATATTTPTIESQIQSADSATVTGNADFTLTRIEDGKAIYQGRATSSAPFDRTLQNYADLRAGRDAELRIAKSLADEIELRVAAALAKTP